MTALQRRLTNRIHKFLVSNVRLGQARNSERIASFLLEQQKQSDVLSRGLLNLNHRHNSFGHRSRSLCTTVLCETGRLAVAGE